MARRWPREAAVLVERELGWGISHIICTPHITQDTFENTPEIISAAFAKLKEAVEKKGTAVTLDYSAEHRLDPFFRSELGKVPYTPHAQQLSACGELFRPGDVEHGPNDF